MENNDGDNTNSFLDDLVTRYKARLDNYILKVKDAHRFGLLGSAEDVVMAITILTRVFPEISSASIGAADDVPLVPGVITPTPSSPILTAGSFASMNSTGAGPSTLLAGNPTERRQHQTPVQTVRLPRLIQYASFSPRVPEDRHEPEIAAVLLLPDGLVVVADSVNHSVKLFNATEMGRFVDSQPLEQPPVTLALVEQQADTWSVAVPACKSPGISILEVTATSIQYGIQNTIKAKGACTAVAAFYPQCLAVGFKHVPGIFLIDNKGKVERQLSPKLKPSFITALNDGVGLACIHGNEIYKWKHNQWLTYEVPTSQIKHLGGIALTSNGLVVADRLTRSLHLLDGSGLYVGQMWQDQRGNDRLDPLEALSVHEQSFACATRKGPVYVLKPEPAA